MQFNLLVIAADKNSLEEMMEPYKEFCSLDYLEFIDRTYDIKLDYEEETSDFIKKDDEFILLNSLNYLDRKNIQDCDIIKSQVKKYMDLHTYATNYNSFAFLSDDTGGIEVNDRDKLLNVLQEHPNHYLWLCDCHIGEN